MRSNKRARKNDVTLQCKYCRAQFAKVERHESICRQRPDGPRSISHRVGDSAIAAAASAATAALAVGMEIDSIGHMEGLEEWPSAADTEEKEVAEIDSGGNESSEDEQHEQLAHQR